MTERLAGVRVELLGPDEGPRSSAFAHDLRAGTGPATEFLPALPRDEAAWRALLDEAAAAAPSVPPALCDALARRQRELGAGPRAEANARTLSEGAALAVVTGQQPGLLGGPLLTFHKVAGAIALARKLDALGDRPVVPVFWLASEDHDFDEANRAVVIDRRGQARGLRLEMQGDGRSLMDLEVPQAESDALLGRLEEALPDTARGRAAVELSARRPSEDFPTWCARVLVSVFGDSGLVVLEPPVIAPWMGDTLAWLVENAEAIEGAVRETGDALERAGLAAPLLSQAPGTTPVFYRAEPGGPRLRVELDESGGLRLRGEPAPFDRAALAAQLRDEPLRGSGNVVGRVFVQNRLLPAVAYVAGPTEIAYQAQVRAAHRALGLFFPLAVPRPVATWLDPKIARAIDAFGVALGPLISGAAEPPAADAAGVDAALEEGAAWLSNPPPDVEALLARKGRTRDAVERALERLRAAWEKAGGAIRAGADADAGVGQARWARVQALVRPHGRAQDRLLSPLSLIARHGLESVRAGLQSLDPLPLAHHLVRLGEE